jgi:GNAT superfamily N-acetyltransferase
MQIVSFEPVHVPEAAAMFARAFRALRRTAPLLSDRMKDPAEAARRLSEMSAAGAGVAALDGARLIGFLAGWWPIERFRGADRIGAYVPEWAHAATGGDRAAVYRALYRAISARWAAVECDVHAITLLANDRAALDAWFWNGFGLGTVDAVRPMTPINAPPPDGFTVRAGAPADVSALAALDAEHNRHYSMPPVFMAPRTAADPAAWEAFLARPDNTAWLAEDAGGPFGFIRFDANDFDGADAAVPDAGAFISGAYVRSDRRGRGAAAAILDAALRHYGDRGLTCCALDFEAFNPEAASFWMKYFEPVCYSLMRVPEWRPAL